MTVAAKLELANLFLEMGILKNTSEYIKFLNLSTEEFMKELEHLEKVKNTKLEKALK